MILRSGRIKLQDRYKELENDDTSRLGRIFRVAEYLWLKLD